MPRSSSTEDIRSAISSIAGAAYRFTDGVCSALDDPSHFSTSYLDNPLSGSAGSGASPPSSR